MKRIPALVLPFFLFAASFLFAEGPSPETSTVAGPGGLNNPFGVIVGLDGNIYFCDTGNHSIKKISRKNGQLTTVAGTGNPGYSGDGGPPLKAALFEPYELRFHPGGDLYWVEMRNHIVRKLDARSHTVSTVAGTGGKSGFSGDGGPARDALMNRPHSIQFDQEGRFLYICDIGNHRIRRVDLKTGNIDTWCGNGKKSATPEGAKAGPAIPLKGPRALDIDPSGDFWLALREGNALYRIDMPEGRLHHVAGTGEKGFSAKTGLASQAKLSGPKGVAVSPDGKLVYLADTESHTVRAVDLGVSPSVLKLVVGSGKRGDGPDAGNPLACQMARLHGVGTDPVTGDLYIGDSETNKVRVVKNLPGSIPWKRLAEYRQEHFQLNGIKCRVALPDKAAFGKPWIWRCRFFGAFPGLDETLLASGWHVAWIDVANLFGGPEAMQRFDAFYEEVRKRYQLAEKPVMEGFSRGGLPAMNWAIRHPGKVRAIYLDAAVMDLRSWPAKSSPRLLEAALAAYQLERPQDLTTKWKGPLDQLAPLAEAKVPIFIVAGGNDEVVPYAENSGILEERYRKLGGRVEAIVKASCGHHPHGLYGPVNQELGEQL